VSPRWDWLKTEVTTNSQSLKVDSTNVFVINHELNDRESYMEADLKADHWADFMDEYEQAVGIGSDWVKNPWGLVFKFLGYPNYKETGNPVYLYVYYPQSNKAIAILNDRQFSDTMSAIEWRIDMDYDGEYWQIDWAGMRQRCSRTIDSAWTKGPCP
jgi:hypothetical protein